MRRALLGVLIGGWISLSAHAAPAPFLWEVRSGDRTHYLLGSVHLLPESAHPLPAALDAAYRAADTVIFESDLAALEAPELQRSLLLAARSRGLRNELPAPLYARLGVRAAQLGMTATVCDPYTAWFCAMTLELAAFREQGFEAARGIDQHFFERALADDKNLVWLETPAAHLQVFTRMGEALGAEYLRATLDDEQNPEEQPAALFAAWQRGDDRFVEKLVTRMRQESPQLYTLLLADRNRAWLPQLEAALKDAEPQLIIVGAAHLYGPDGLLSALRARGFAIRSAAPAPSR